MPGYVKKILQKFQHNHPDYFTITAHAYTPPVYGQKIQMAKTERIVPLLPKDGIMHID